MMIKSYEHEKYVARLTEWLRLHGLGCPDRRLFSDIGVVVDDCAIGFLFTTNSKQAYIDHVAADPGVPKERRDAALNKLFWELERTAKSKGFVMITALAKLPTMRRRFESHDYKSHGEFGLYYKVLGGH